MREFEQTTHQKLKQDFANEIVVLDKGIDAIEQCAQLLIKKTPLLCKPNLRANLMNAKSQDRCSAAQVLLIYHATMFLRAARFLLLNGYPSPSLSCLRTTVESILNAHVCKQSDKQAMNWVKCEKVERKGFRYPKQIPKSIKEQVNDALNQHGVHPNYLAFATQGYYPGLIFSKENKKEYEFFTLRNIHLSLFISNRFLNYLLKRKPSLKREFPDAINITQDLLAKIEEIGLRLREMVALMSAK